MAHSDSTGTRLETHRSCGQGWQSARASQSTVLSQGDRSSCPEGSGASGKDVADSEQQRLQGHVEQQTESSDAPSGCSTDTTVAHTEVERIQGLWSGGIEEPPAYAEQEVPLCRYERIGSSYWETEPNVGRVADGIPSRVDRLKGLGNAIVPQVAYELIRHLETDG